MTATPEKFNVGGILLNQPFKIRRLGHFGFNLVNMDEGVRFYIDWLGFRVSDVMDYSKRARVPIRSLGWEIPMVTSLATAPITTRWSCSPNECATRSAAVKSQESR